MIIKLFFIKSKQLRCVKDLRTCAKLRWLLGNFTILVIKDAIVQWLSEWNICTKVYLISRYSATSNDYLLSTTMLVDRDLIFNRTTFTLRFILTLVKGTLIKVQRHDSSCKRL